VVPLVAIMLAIFEGSLAQRKEAPTFTWTSRNNTKYTYDAGLYAELDVAIEWGGLPPMAGLPHELLKLVSTIEMKTPKACNEPSILAFSGPLETAKQIRNQVSL
jgi:hypothetical protein